MSLNPAAAPTFKNASHLNQFPTFSTNTGMKNRRRLGGIDGKVLTLDDVNVDGKTVLLRVDINSPLDPATKAFLDDTRIRAILPTIQKLVRAKVIILAHQSRPGKDDYQHAWPCP